MLKWLQVTALSFGLMLAGLYGNTEYEGDWGLENILQVSDGSYYLAASLTNEIYRFSRDNELIARTTLPALPMGMTLSQDSGSLIVTGGVGTGYIHILESKSLKTKKSFKAGHSPQAPCFSPDGFQLAISQRFKNEVWIYDARTWQISAKHPVLREPVDLHWRHDSELVVLHHLSDRSANADWTGVSIAKLNTRNGRITEIPLEDGSSGARKLALTPDKRYALSAMTIGSHRVPATQIERGWIIKNGLSVIDLDNAKMLGTLLLDDLYRGAANPWDIQISDTKAWVSLSGTHQIIEIDYPALIQTLESFSEQEREQMGYDLRLGYAWKRRFDLKGLGPRALSFDPQSNSLLIASYFNNAVERFSSSESEISLELPPKALRASRQGEFHFHNAMHSFQNWMSCASCHPDARTDALNWDLENDGVGTPRQAKSLLLAHQTPPTTVTGIRPNAETSVRAGIKFLRSAMPESDAQAIDFYLSSLSQTPSPYLIDGNLSPSAEQGKRLFRGKAGCAECHNGNNYTNKALEWVGTGIDDESELKFDVPTLREVWRSAPYLHDGRATSIHESMTRFNPEHMHGETDQLSSEELDQLIEYVHTL